MESRSSAFWYVLFSILLLSNVIHKIECQTVAPNNIQKRTIDDAEINLTLYDKFDDLRSIYLDIKDMLWNEDQSELHPISDRIENRLTAVKSATQIHIREENICDESNSMAATINAKFKLQAHHIIPNDLLMAFFRRIFRMNEPSLVAQLALLRNRIEETITNSIGAPEFNDQTRDALATYIPLNDKRKYANKNDFSFTMFNWLPGNIIIGPKVDDVGNSNRKIFQENIKFIVGMDKFSVLKRIYTLMIEIEKELAKEETNINTKKNIHTNYEIIFGLMNEMVDWKPLVYPFVEQNWIQLKSGIWNLNDNE